MCWLYILKLANSNYYVGSTRNLIDRVNRHKQGRNESTSKYLPIELIYQKEFPNYSMARKAEILVKRQKSHIFIEKIVSGKFCW